MKLGTGELSRGGFQEVLYKHPAMKKYVYIINILNKIFSKHMVLKTNMQKIILAIKHEQKGPSW